MSRFLPSCHPWHIHPATFLLPLSWPQALLCARTLSPENLAGETPWGVFPPLTRLQWSAALALFKPTSEASKQRGLRNRADMSYVSCKYEGTVEEPPLGPRSNQKFKETSSGGFPSKRLELATKRKPGRTTRGLLDVAFSPMKVEPPVPHAGPPEFAPRLRAAPHPATRPRSGARPGTSKRLARASCGLLRQGGSTESPALHGRPITQNLRPVDQPTYMFCQV